MARVTWVMMPSVPAGNQHFLRIAVVAWVHHRGSGDNGTATEFVSLTHLNWNRMARRQDNRCQQAISDHALWVTVQLGAMRDLERNIPQAGFERALWESGALIAVQWEAHLV